MDLNAVIAELRAELENIKQVAAALEKLYEIRNGQTVGSIAEIPETLHMPLNENTSRLRGRPRKQPPAAEHSNRS